MEPNLRQDTRPPTPVGYEDGLHVCDRCACGLVQPVWWDEVPGGCWRVELRCPDCEHRRQGVFAQCVVDSFDERLNEGSDALASTYRRMVRDNLVGELERFAGALRAGAILPEDF